MSYLTQGKIVRTYEGHTSYVFCIACHPLSTLLVSGGFDETIRLWDLQRGTCHRTIAAHSEAVTGVDFSSDGTMIASCSYDGLMCVVLLTQPPMGYQRRTLPAHAAARRPGAGRLGEILAVVAASARHVARQRGAPLGPGQRTHPQDLYRAHEYQVRGQRRANLPAVRWPADHVDRRWERRPPRIPMGPADAPDHAGALWALRYGGSSRGMSLVLPRSIPRCRSSPPPASSRTRRCVFG